MEIITIDIGDNVVCDLCNVDYTNSKESGGFYFSGKAVCPKCAPEFLKNIQKYREEKYIKGTCPKDKSFADWVRDDLKK